jgi:serine/threonine protein kinase
MQVKRLSNSEVIHLDEILGTGGEGSVYGILKYPSWVAKIYHPQKVTLEHSYKLKVMFENPPQDASIVNGHPAIAWPLDLLIKTDGNQEIVGFLMHRVSQMRPIHDFYTPKTRRQEIPAFTYLGLHRIARNLAIAVSRLHERGYIIGDINESNILVDSNTALVTLVDVDSFQVHDTKRGMTYRCPVGKPEFTPPELQGVSFRDCDRIPEHDLFGLGVLIFQLLMEGTHPFDGVFQGKGEVPAIASRISIGHFPYSNHVVPYLPKPFAPDLEILHPGLRQSFLSCFQDGYRDSQVRLTARAWVQALVEAENALVQCSANPQHHYGKHGNDCPWCTRTHQLKGLDPFPSTTMRQQSLASLQSAITNANIPQVENQMTLLISSVRTHFVSTSSALRQVVQPSVLSFRNSLRATVQPTVRSTIAIFRKPHILIGAGITLTILASLVYVHRLNESKMMPLFYKVELLKNKGEFKDCIEKADDFPKNSRLYSSVMEISSQCRFSMIKELGKRQDFKAALSLLRETPQNDPLFTQHQQLIIQFVDEAIELATQNYELGHLEEAIKIIRDISQIYILPETSKRLPERWKEEWDKNASLMSSIENAQGKGEWQNIVTMSSQITTRHWISSAQKIVDEAYMKLAQQSLKTGRWDDAIIQANKVGNSVSKNYSIARQIVQQAQTKKMEMRSRIAQNSNASAASPQTISPKATSSSQPSSQDETSEVIQAAKQEDSANHKSDASPEVFDVPLDSEVGVDYTELQNLLAQGKWLEADWETKLVMHKVVDRPLYNSDDGSLRHIFTEEFTCKDFQTIDQLWEKASEGRFGFGVQWRIWKEIIGGDDLSWQTISWEHGSIFARKVGWRKQEGNGLIEFDRFVLTLNEAPAGQFPTVRWWQGNSYTSNSTAYDESFIEIDNKFHECGMR